MTLLARQRQDRAGGGAPDARQRGDVGKGAGKLPAELIAQALRRAVQVTGARVVAEPRPQVQHFIEWRFGQCAQPPQSAP